MNKLKNEVFENKEKGYTRYKIAHFRKFNPSEKKTKSGYTFFLYVYKDKIRLVRHGWYAGYYEKGKINTGNRFVTIKYLKGTFKMSKDGHVTTFQSFLSMFSVSLAKIGPTITYRLQKVIKKWSESLGHTYKIQKNCSLDNVFGKLVYPSLQRLELKTKLQKIELPNTKRLLSLHLSLKEMIKRTLGSCGKKTYKLVCQKLKEGTCVGYTLDKLYVFKKLFKNIDDIQLALQRPIFSCCPVSYIDNHRRRTSNPSRELIEFLSKFTKTRLLSENAADFGYMTTTGDTIRMWKQLQKPDIPHGLSIAEYHDTIAVRQRKIVQKNYDLEPSEDMMSIDGLQISEYTIVVPKTRDELVGWGNLMNNCIASYAQSMRDKNVHLFGVKEKDRLIYNVMLYERFDFLAEEDKKRLNFKEEEKYDCGQFYGKCNSHVEPALVNKILGSLPIKVNAGHYGKIQVERNEGVLAW